MSLVKNGEVEYELPDRCAVFWLPEILGSDFHIFTQHDDFNPESSIPKTYLDCR